MAALLIIALWSGAYCGKCADEEEDRSEEEGAGAGGGSVMRGGEETFMGDDY